MDSVSKPLQEMSLEELWEHFPIFLLPHQSCWAAWYEEEAAFLAGVLPAGTVLHHIGSTAVNGIKAKPVIDILAEVPPGERLADIQPLVEAGGYICMNAAARRISFNKGYTPEGYAERVFHLHVVPAGQTDEVLFRDYLRAHPETAKAYEDLKLQLADRYSHDRDAYTEAKSSFVSKIICKAGGE